MVIIFNATNKGDAFETHRSDDVYNIYYIGAFRYRGARWNNKKPFDATLLKRRVILCRISGMVFESNLVIDTIENRFRRRSDVQCNTFTN